jgi:lipoprotein-anchoring transpeptidase ErfK/SrfK
MHQPPLAPEGLQVATTAGQAIAPDTWTNQADLRLVAALRSPEPGALLQPEVEFRPVEETLAGEPNVVGAPGTPSVPAPAMEPGRRYQWQARAREAGGRPGPWTRFDGAIGYAPNPPAAPQIAALPNDGVVMQRSAHFEWTAGAGEVGIAGYAYAVDRLPDGAPPAEVNATEPAATVALPEDGDWYFHVRALDNAGNWSAAATAALHVDTVPLQIADVTYRTFAYYPGYGTLPINFKVNKPSDVTVTILPANADTPLRTYQLGAQQDVVKVAWDGKDDDGRVVPAGGYRFRVQAADQYGRTADAIYTRLLVTYKRIVVSLGRQALTAFDGDTAVLSTLVTTGGPELPTPTGTFQVLAKFSPFTFHSPWPKSSPYWYPDSPTSYAMLFEDGGYFIHDAPWRSYFGPGSNAVDGRPGGNGTGTHGCVNVPFGVQARLFAWADVGTPVVVTY